MIKMDVYDFLKKRCDYDSIEQINTHLHNIVGVDNFFLSKSDYEGFLDFIQKDDAVDLTKGREWGDIQTPKKLTDKICLTVKNALNFEPDIILEPTYGIGNFIMSSIEIFPNLKKIYGVEINKKFAWWFKRSLLEKFLNTNKKLPKICLYTEDIFAHKFDLNFCNNTQKLLIIGNPPWVTSTELSSLLSTNIPEKSNFKKFSGLDAMTGKSNFDLGEYIIIQLLNIFPKKTGKLVILCKRTVVINLVKELPNCSYNIGDIKIIPIDAQKIFNRSVDAVLLIADLGKKSTDYTCTELSFNEPTKVIKKFGWIENHFVSNVDIFKKYRDLDGKSPLTWRGGIKHDCSSILELKSSNSHLINGLDEKVDIEDDRLYPLLKGSMLKNFLTLETNRKLIVTQKNLSEDTTKLKAFPKLWKYINSKSNYFEKRKSKVYKRKYPFSIFGVGDYSFLPYKVAIASMYKEPFFSVCLPIDKNPVVFDDTCYFLSFKNKTDAIFTGTILNSNLTKKFLESIVFIGSKRPYTKEILSRINLSRIALKLSFDDIKKIWNENNFDNADELDEKKYAVFRQKVNLT